MNGVHNDKNEIIKFIKKHIRIDPQTGCHKWTGTSTNKGHGYMLIGGAAFAVRRVVWWLRKGYLPRGEFVKSGCKDPWCCNPRHIYDNTPLADRRGSLFKKGSGFNAPRVSPKKAGLMWEALMMGELTWKEAARKCATSVQTLRKHVKRFEESLES